MSVFSTKRTSSIPLDMHAQWELKLARSIKKNSDSAHLNVIVHDVNSRPLQAWTTRSQRDSGGDELYQCIDFRLSALRPVGILSNANHQQASEVLGGRIWTGSGWIKAPERL